MMNLSNITIPKIRISVRVVACIIAIVGIIFFYWATSTKVPEIETKTSRLESENKTLEQTEKNLNTLYQNMSFYLSDTDRLNKETEEVLTEFPTFMYLEDKILYADTLLKTDLQGYNLMDFSYGQSNYITSVVYGPQEKPLELYSVGLSGQYKDLTYTQIKELLNYGLSSPQRFVIKTITMGYNQESGYISGEFSFNTYFIPGQSTPYEFPQSVIEGLGNSDRIDDLFGARKNPIDEVIE